MAEKSDSREQRFRNRLEGSSPGNHDHHKGEPLLANQLLAKIFDTIDSLLVVLDRGGHIVLFNHACEATTGYQADEVEGRLIWDVLIPRENAESIKQVFYSLSAGQFPSRYDNEWVRKDGSRCLISWSNTATLNDQGEVELVIGTGADITEQRALQEQLLQAQKMEAIGQLTGGLAHDFNNLLTVTLGNLELLEMRIEDEGQRELLTEALEATDLGARITDRLLAFARRSPLKSEVVDLNMLVVGLTDMLHRTLGETIDLSTALSTDLWVTRTDATQIETAIVNLAVNARDAMPGGGKLIVETRNMLIDENYVAAQSGLEPGGYVQLSVSDTGNGMTPEIRDRVFEPFFTTKEFGRGTGLGLSMIYGFAKQSDGHVTIDSEPGMGTVVNLYLPRHDAAAETATPDPAKTLDSTLKGELILVVEDDDRVRRLTLTRLKELGYEVLEAANGPAALTVLEGARSVDLVFTDLIMPGGMSGYELCEEVRKRGYKVKLLLTSGYADEYTHGDKLQSEHLSILRKPYRQANLASRIKQTLVGD